MKVPGNAWLEKLLARLPGFFCVRRSDSLRQNWEIPALLVCVAAGAFVRFWGLGSWGLEYDEETMAMPTMHILKDGLPLLPSGMFYARGISQLYMMAAAVKLLGATEFALRLPSVLCGVALIVIAYPLGRRFLGPFANICFVATVAFLPGLIADSQEARMYIFMITSLAAFAVFVFRWEISGRMADLVAAVIVAIIGLQFHVLTIFGAFLLYFPAFLQGDTRKFRLATIALVVLLTSYVLISSWVEHFYPHHSASAESAVQLQSHVAGSDSMRKLPLLALAAVLACAVVAWVGARGVNGRSTAIAVGSLLFLGLASQSLFAWHIGLLLLGVAVVIAARAGCRASAVRLLALVLVSTAICLLQFHVLRAMGVSPARKILGALVGAPSVWPMLRFASFSPVALVLVGIGLVEAAWLLMRKRVVADVWLFALLTVWLPLFLIGFFSWDIEPRYGEFALLPALLCALAMAQRVAESAFGRVGTPTARAWKVGAVTVVATMAMVNPLAVARAVNSGYAIHPDHKGAAEYMRSLKLGSSDVVLAEDVNQQTYYLGHVDYWLIAPSVAAEFVENVDGEPRDIYTHTRVMDSASRLQALLEDTNRGAVYVIGSGENQEDGRLQMRGAELDTLLRSSRFEEVYRGRDGLTRVLKAVPRFVSTDHSMQSP